VNKVVFSSVQEALEALKADKLGTVYYRGREVFVVTAFGSGTFPTEAWRSAGGPENSVKLRLVK
jgi:hypothetical protein